jgi:hypothetical protein
MPLWPTTRVTLMWVDSTRLALNRGELPPVASAPQVHAHASAEPRHGGHALLEPGSEGTLRRTGFPLQACTRPWSAVNSWDQGRPTSNSSRVSTQGTIPS